MNCRVCSTELEHKYGICSYCGYDNRPVLTVSSEDSSDHCRELLSQIGGFSINVCKYRWNEQKQSFSVLETVELFDKNLTGNDFYQNVKVSDIEIAQIGIGRTKEIEIEYNYDGHSRKAAFEIAPVQCCSPWRIGLRIDGNLRLSVLIGDLRPGKPEPDGDCVEVDGIELDFTDSGRLC